MVSVGDLIKDGEEGQLENEDKAFMGEGLMSN